MKKLFAILMACFLLFPTVCAHAEDDKPLSIVCTTFPQYDWVRQILGEREADVSLTLLMDNGVDLHNYQPAAADIVAISTSDLFVYVGGESDGWVQDVLAAAQNPGLIAVSMLSCVEAKEEEMVEGMQKGAHAHDHGGMFAPEDIKDRTLADFAGEWSSLWPMMKDGTLDAYCTHQAQEDGDPQTTADTYRELYTAAWACDMQSVWVDGDTILFTGLDGTTSSGRYTYAGYAVKTDEEGQLSVRYQFETEDDGAPHYVQFCDHGHAPGAAEHFHFYFGDDGFDALTAAQGSSFFVPASLDADGVLRSLMEHSHGPEYDEHIWLSLRNAQSICEVLAGMLCELDPDHAQTYLANMQSYIAQLRALDEQYQAVVNSAARKTILFADRFPFRYLADDYGLSYYAAFVGCSAETEASFETIAFLAKQVDEQSLPVVLVIEGDDHDIAQTVVISTQTKDQPIMVMDSMQSVTASAIENGASYLGVMTDNLDVLKAALR